MANPSIISRKNEIKEISEILKSPEVQRDKERYRKYVQQVIAFMTLGIDVSSLFSEMIMASVTNDLVQKKLVYLYIRVQAKSNKDVAILMISTLTKDASDDNPMIRGLALRTMCELKIKSLLDYIKEPLVRGLSDKSSYVRKIAVIGVLKLFHFAPNMVKELNLTQLLLDKLNDNDKQVVTNSIFVLMEIWGMEGEVTVKKDIVRNIFSRLSSLNEWSQSCLISVLSRYVPESQEEILDVLNSLDDKLKHPNKGVVLATAKVFLIYTKDLEFLNNDVFNRLVGPLLSIITAPLPELAYTGLCMLSIMYRGRTHLLAGKLKAFFLRGNELSYLKKLRLAILTEVVNESNIETVLTEIRYGIMDMDVCVARYAVKCVGKIGTKYKDATNSCLDILLGLLDLELDHLSASIFESIKDILTEMKDFGNTIVANVNDYWEKTCDNSAKAALLWILGEFGHTIQNSPYMLEVIVQNLDQEQSSAVRLALLNAAVRLFFKRPPEFQNIVGTIFYHLIEDEMNMDVHDRASFYYRCLKKDAAQVHKLLSTARDLQKGNKLNTQSRNLPEMMVEDLNTLSLLATNQALILH